MIAAEHWPTSEIYEISSPSAHSGNFIRMRADALANRLKLPATKVTAYSCVLSTHEDGSFSYHEQATPADMINYSRKVVGVLSARSIMSCGLRTRWVLGADALLELRQRHRSRISFNAALPLSHWTDPSIPVVNTAPIAVAAGILDIPLSVIPAHSAIIVRAPVPASDSSLSVTLYVPSPAIPVTRITLSEGWLVLELNRAGYPDSAAIEFARKALGLLPHEIGAAQRTVQPSKLAPQTEEIRTLIYAMSANYNVWSLGRHATARHDVLIEHLPHDCEVIDKFLILRSGSCQYKSLIGAIKS